MTNFEEVRRIIESCQGYTIDLVSLAVLEQASALEIGLRWGPSKPDVFLSCRDILHLTIGRFPDSDFGPMDSLSAVHLPPSDEPWPEPLRYDLKRTSSLPSLLWIHAEGPVQLDVIAATVTALSEAT